MTRITKVISDDRVNSNDIKAQVEKALRELFDKYGDDGIWCQNNFTVIIEIIDEEQS